MSDQRIDETCACGARFSVSGSYAGMLAAEWRIGHRHTDPSPDGSPPQHGEPQRQPADPIPPPMQESSTHAPTSLGFTSPGTEPRIWGDE